MPPCRAFLTLLLVSAAGLAAAETLTVPRGYLVDVRVNQDLSSDQLREGDTFTATVIEAVYIDGRAAIPEGSVVDGQVSLVRSHEEGHRSGVLGLRFVALRTPDGNRHPLDGALVGFRRQTTQVGEVTRVKTSPARAVVVIGTESDGPGKRPSSLVGEEGENEEALATRWAASGLSPDIAEIEAGSELTFELRRPARIESPAAD